MTIEMTPGLIKQSEAARYLGLSEATLERDRWRGGGGVLHLRSVWPSQEVRSVGPYV